MSQNINTSTSFILGDSIPIQIQMSDYSYSEELIISFVKNGCLYTCGHCLPTNSIINFGYIMVTSGFGNNEEGKEIAIVKLNSYYKNKIHNMIDNQKVYGCRLYLQRGDMVINYYKRTKTYGYIINLINSDEDIVNCGWKLESTINKLDFPYYLISAKNYEPNTIKCSKERKFFPEKNIKLDKIGKLSSPGFSGSPWIVKKKNKHYFFGIHIGKVLGLNKNSKKISEIAYVKIY